MEIKLGRLFATFANRAAEYMGSPWAFIAACLIIITWLVSGPIFGFSDTWQLIINTGTTIITFIMVFIIQNSQNRDTKAIQIKIDELIAAHPKARNTLIDLASLSEEELIQLEEQFKKLAKKRTATRKKNRSKKDPD